MNSRVTSITVGLVLIVGTGWLVSSKKNADLMQISAENQVTDTENSTSNTSADLESINPNSIVTPTPTPKPKPVETPNTSTPEPTVTPKPVSSGITSVEVAKHNSRQDCWSIISGNVYDLTSWIPNHPGGEKVILQLCGIDGTSKYNSEHRNDKKPARILSGFKVGVFSK